MKVTRLDMPTDTWSTEDDMLRAAADLARSDVDSTHDFVRKQRHATRTDECTKPRERFGQ